MTPEHSAVSSQEKQRSAVGTEEKPSAISHQPSGKPNPYNLVIPWIFASAAEGKWLPKLVGEKAECAFAYQAMEHGLIVSKPYGDSAPYDFVVQRRSQETGDGRQAIGRRPSAVRKAKRGDGRGPVWLVQVKSCASLDKGATYMISAQHSGRVYDKSQCDFIAAWVTPEDAWYIIPIEALDGRSMAGLYPHRPGSRGKYEKYREAWELMK